MQKSLHCIVAMLFLIAPSLAAQDPHQVPATPEVEPWQFSGSVFYSDPPGTSDRVTAIVYADRGPLHLEGRYGYEDKETASVFAGWTLTGSEGDGLSVSLTPMLGAVVGNTDGIAPGLEADLGWRRLAWYVEAEYLFDAHDSDDDFFYSWSTLTFGFTDWLRAGLVTERTKLVDTDFSVQPGLALEISNPHFVFSLYAYDIGTDDHYAVVSLGLAP